MEYRFCRWRQACCRSLFLRKMICRPLVAWYERVGPDSTCGGARARARTQTQTSDDDRPKCAALTLERTQDQALLKEQRNPAFSRTYNHTDQCFFKPQLFHHTKHQHIPQFCQAPAEGISRGPCKHTLLLPRLQHNSLVAPQYTIFLEPPAQTTIVPDSLEGISTRPARYTGAPAQRIQSLTKHNFYEHTFVTTKQQRHHRRPGLASNPSQE